ncbi:MAG: mandelate racemase/muconate lactonizing enzyme family protein [Ruminococcaceae bacterium]|nr:mandelate racemase/muconate lactonizing enzyme family protein [Oscillospiraceae bacterium]
MAELKITDVKTYLVPAVPAAQNEYNWSGTKALLFVKIETDGGIDGWGECYTLADREQATATHVQEMRRYLIGADPTAIKRFQYWAYHLFGERRPGIDLICAASGIEIAMWDIFGKSLGVPVWKLLGGAVRDRVPVYLNLGSGWLRTPREEVEMVRELSGRFGYRAVKLYPFDFMRDEDEIVEHISAVREGLGREYRLMIDVWREIDLGAIRRIAKRIEACDVTWYEEPIAPDNLDALADLRRTTSLPIVAGEAMFGKRAFRDLFRRGAADIINPDVSVVGGILELKEIAAMAESEYIQVGPHNCNSSTVAASASVHAACTMPNLDMLETFPWYWQLGDKLCKNQLRVEDGHIRIPEGPGLGLEMDEAYLASLHYEPRPMNRWTNRP